MPTNHFDGVNEFGYVSIWEKIGEIDAGDGLKLPLHINFRSDREKVSPYLGYGWHFALLESSFTQVAENTFMMYEPAGLFRLFWRDGKNPTILNGQGGWKAEIRGDTITAVADCGGKLVFNRGRITSIQLKDRKFDFVYDGGALSEVRAGAVSLLRVEKEAITGEVTGVQLANNEQIAIERGQRPRIRTINDQNQIVGMEKSLSKLTLADGSAQNVEYAVDDKLNPTMRIGERLIAWNPASKTILRDGAWTYDIKAGSGRFVNSAIGRTNTKNQKEFWHRDEPRGEEVAQGVDGVKKITSWFTGGSLRGKLRSRKSVIDSSDVIKSFARRYDESGLTIAVESDDLTIHFRDRDHVAKVTKGNIVVFLSD